MSDHQVSGSKGRTRAVWAQLVVIGAAAFMILFFQGSLPVLACSQSCSCTYNSPGHGCSENRTCSSGNYATCNCSSAGCTSSCSATCSDPDPGGGGSNGQCHGRVCSEISIAPVTRSEIGIVSMTLHDATLEGVKAHLELMGWKVVLGHTSDLRIDRDYQDVTIKSLVESLSAEFGACGVIDEKHGTIFFHPGRVCGR